MINPTVNTKIGLDYGNSIMNLDSSEGMTDALAETNRKGVEEILQNKETNFEQLLNGKNDSSLKLNTTAAQFGYQGYVQFTHELEQKYPADSSIQSFTLDESKKNVTEIIIEPVTNELLANVITDVNYDLSNESFLSQDVGLESFTKMEIIVYPNGGFKTFALGNLEQSMVLVGNQVNISNGNQLSMGNQNNALVDINDNLKVQEVKSLNMKPVEYGSRLQIDSQNLLDKKIDKRVENGVLEYRTKSSYAMSSDWQEMIRKITLVSKDEQLTIYLRDYHLDEYQRSRVISELTSQLKQTLHQTKLMINGEIYEYNK